MSGASRNDSPVSRARVLVAGATGYIGRAVVRELLSRGAEVTALVRPGAAAEALDAIAGAELRRCDPCDAAALGASLGGETWHVVISCLASRSGAPADARRVDYGANRNLLQAFAGRPDTHFILLSAICVQRPRLAFQFAKLEFEQRLAASGLRYTIVRPTAYFKSLAGQVARVSRGKPFMVFGDGEMTACKPISEVDLAGFMVDCIADPARRNAVLPIGGPGPALTPLDQADILFALLDRPRRLRRVPVWVMDGIIGVLRLLSRLDSRFADRCEFARIGRYYATESMLVWDAEVGAYSAEATPEAGADTLRDFYQRILEHGMAGQELGEHALFDRSAGRREGQV